MSPPSAPEPSRLPQKILTQYQVMAIVASSVIGVGVLTLPRIAVERADTGAPLATATAVAVSMAAVAVLVHLGRRFPDMSLFQYAEAVMGRWAGKAVSLLLVAFFVELAALTAREFGEVVVSAVLPRTPLEVTTVILILLAAVASRNNVGTFGRIHEVYLPFIVFPAVGIVILSLKNASDINLLPLMGQGWPGIAKGTLIVTALFQAFAVLGAVQPHARNPRRVLRAALFGTALAGAVYTLAVIGALGIFGRNEIRGLLWPTLEMAKATAVPGGIIERLDALFLTVWVTAVFTTVYSVYFMSVTGLTHVFELRDHRAFVFPLIPVIYFLALRPTDIQVLYRIVVVVGEAGLPLTIGWPALIWLVATLRRMGRAAPS